MMKTVCICTFVSVLIGCSSVPSSSSRAAEPTPRAFEHRYVCVDGKLSPMCTVENHRNNVAGCCAYHGGMLTVRGSLVQTVNAIERK